ncbi:tetratricopeptide repeat protein [Ignatzschineria rhizosphaerae]|uniref:Ancillary SecYEG translocon subunit n=1 Tax=Ignatzschineria rhizosphaerae TaxID=2923279 RepID=A0ABY3WXA0_9GAMM|nr:tetratricopeptide repeat protein [Ignatzschineria rhizosphaerae]UNM95233.1 tetratricopeptide repeat protein [Ignatzschineria rhizosphaerae]
MALNQYETDEQRAEVLIDWLKRNVGYLLFLVVLVVGSIAGVEFYKSHTVSKANATFDSYEAFLAKYDNAPVDAAMSEKLVADNDGVYQVFSAMLLAKEAHDAGELNTAETLLTSALTNADDEGLKALLQYRLAIVQFDQGNNEVALESLKQVQAVEFLGLRKVLEGDIYLSMGRTQDAKISYEEALNSDIVPDGALNKLNRLSAQ